MISMEMDCVVYPGERVPRNPGFARPTGSSLYARLGGIYPIALFVDRLVDALLDDERVDVPMDAQKRNETKLLVPKSAWRILMATAEAAADHLPQATRPSL